MKRDQLHFTKDRSLVNLGNSILRFFGEKQYHDSLKEADEFLAQSKKKKVCLILLDGLGKVILDYYKDDAPFLASHIITTYKSTFPPTTVAATTALITAKYPIETGCVGWTQYFSQFDAAINVFISKDEFKKDVFYKPHVFDELIKPFPIYDQINKSGKFKATVVTTVNTYYLDENGKRISDFDTLFKNAEKALSENDFVYIYSNYPDALLHDFGCKNTKVRDSIKFLEAEIIKLMNNHPDFCFLITPDHGFVDVKEINFYEHQDFINTLENKHFIIEGRFAGVKVKNEKAFKELFEKYYSDKFDLYSQKEILDNHIFGYGEMNKYFIESLCDYYLLSKSEYLFYQAEKPIGFKGHHAGITSDETDIYLFGYYQ